jgi:NAD/NADP transhydrogenase beta subunit
MFISASWYVVYGDVIIPSTWQEDPITYWKLGINEILAALSTLDQLGNCVIQAYNLFWLLNFLLYIAIIIGLLPIITVEVGNMFVKLSCIVRFESYSSYMSNICSFQIYTDMLVNLNKLKGYCHYQTKQSDSDAISYNLIFVRE